MGPYAVIDIAGLVGVAACILCIAVSELRPHALQALVMPASFVAGGYAGIFVLLLLPPSGSLWSQSEVVTGTIIVAVFVVAGLVTATLAAVIAGRIQRLLPSPPRRLLR